MLVESTMQDLPTTTSIDEHGTANATHRAIILVYPLWSSVLISIGVFVVWLLCCLGNALVVIAIAVDRRLKGVQHWFLASLAAADFLLGVLVLPFTLVKQLLGVWVFGERWCELWLVIDVLLCTASILNLCLISLDRYWCVSQPLTYPQSRSARRAGGMIALVWLLAVGICVPPLLGWRQTQPNVNTCQLTEDIGYVLYSTIGSFYIPTTIMSVVYVKIFMVTREHARRRHARHGEITTTSLRLRATRNPSSNSQLKMCAINAKPLCPADSINKAPNLECTNLCATVDVALMMQDDDDDVLMDKKKNNENNASTLPAAVEENAVENYLFQKRKFAKNRERRATIILGLIMGSFILCWFPFFTTYVIEILCRRTQCTSSLVHKDCSCISSLLFDVFFWLGYCNSALNPIIYTVFNRDFRLAFHHILTCRPQRASAGGAPR